MIISLFLLSRLRQPVLQRRGDVVVVSLAAVNMDKTDTMPTGCSHVCDAVVDAQRVVFVHLSCNGRVTASLSPIISDNITQRQQRTFLWWNITPAMRRVATTA